MAQKLLYLSSGFPAEIEALTYSSGTVDSGKFIGLDAQGKIDDSFMPDGVGLDNVAAEASEALSAGNWINLYLDGTLKARKADATTNGKPANGFVKESYESAATATVYRQGFNTSVTGKTIGTKYFLATTPGGDTETAPSTAGNYAQYLGTAVDAASIPFEERVGYTRA